MRDESLFASCRLLYVCEDGCGLASRALAAAADEALLRGQRVIELLSPLDGSSTDGVLLPELSAAFVRTAPQEGSHKKVALDRLCGSLDEIKERRRALRAARRERARCTEAACAVLTFAFEDVGLHKICAKHDVENPASGRIMQKLGMRQEGYMKLDAQRLDGTYSDMVLYGILRDEWLR